MIGITNLYKMGKNAIEFTIRINFVKGKRKERKLLLFFDKGEKKPLWRSILIEVPAYPIS